MEEGKDYFSHETSTFQNYQLAALHIPTLSLMRIIYPTNSSSTLSAKREDFPRSRDTEESRLQPSSTIIVPAYHFLQLICYLSYIFQEPMSSLLTSLTAGVPFSFLFNLFCTFI